MRAAIKRSLPFSALTVLALWLGIANAQILELAAAAATTLAKFAPLSLLVGGLLNSAIDRADSAAQARLEQTNAIIQSAMFNLDRIAKERTADVDSKVRAQRVEAIRELDRMADRLSGILNATTNDVDRLLGQNIANFQNALGNSLASLPIPTEPLINVGKDGITALKQTGTTTIVPVTGSGLFKSNKKPRAFLCREANCASAQGVTEIPVGAYSMGLIDVLLPNDAFTNQSTPMALKLALARGGFFGGSSEPVFPLTVCGPLPLLKLKATYSNLAGKGWEIKPLGPIRAYQECPKGQNAKRLRIVAEAPPGWDVNREYGNHGLIVHSSGGDQDHNESWTPTKDAFYLYCAPTDRGANSWAEYTMQIKRSTEVPICGSASIEMPLSYSGPAQKAFDRVAALGTCDASIKTPESRVDIEILDSSGSVKDRLSMAMPDGPKTALGGLVSLATNLQGQLVASLKPVCQRRFTYAVESVKATR